MLNHKEILERDLSFIRIAHTGQLYNQRPYWHHPVRVMLRLKHYLKLRDETAVNVLKAALLHDVLEDTQATERDLLLFGYHWSVVGLVKGLSRNPDEETYKEFIARIIKTGDFNLMCIKLADLYENSNNLRFIPADKRGRMVRYGKSIEELHAALNTYVADSKKNWGTDGSFPDITAGELDKDEVEKWIGECPSFL